MAECSFCGFAWDPAVCASCGASNFEVYDLAEILYGSKDDDEGLVCGDCEHEWREIELGDGEKCSQCGSRAVSGARKTIPYVTDPGVWLIVAAEGRIARAENGAILSSEMVAWLALHGVSRPAEVREWEDWFLAIGGIRGQIEAEVNEERFGTKPKKEEEEE